MSENKIKHYRILFWLFPDRIIRNLHSLYIFVRHFVSTSLPSHFFDIQSEQAITLFPIFVLFPRFKTVSVLLRLSLNLPNHSDKYCSFRYVPAHGTI